MLGIPPQRWLASTCAFLLGCARGAGLAAVPALEGAGRHGEGGREGTRRSGGGGAESYIGRGFARNVGARRSEPGRAQTLHGAFASFAYDDALSSSLPPVRSASEIVVESCLRASRRAFGKA